MLFDTHAHYDDESFDDDRDEVLSALPKNNVVNVVNCGCDIESSKKSLELAKKYLFIYAAVGIHPENCKNGEELSEIKRLAECEKCVAIGEIGLDYHYGESDREVQKELFAKQIRLANELSLPVIIHERDAFADCLEILKAERPKKGVMHSFSGNKVTLGLILDLGLYIGVGGMLTFKNNVKTVEMCPLIPNDRILIETDCPYLSPVPMRGKRNNSAYLSYVADKIGELKGLTKDEVEKITQKNAAKLFGIK